MTKPAKYLIRSKTMTKNIWYTKGWKAPKYRLSVNSIVPCKPLYKTVYCQSKCQRLELCRSRMGSSNKQALSRNSVLDNSVLNKRQPNPMRRNIYLSPLQNANTSPSSPLSLQQNWILAWQVITITKANLTIYWKLSLSRALPPRVTLPWRNRPW